MHISNLHLKKKVSACAISTCRVFMLLVCLCGLALQGAWAQNNREERLSALVERVDSLVIHYTGKDPVSDEQVYTGDMEYLFRVDYSTSGSNEVKVIEAEQEKLSRDLGLDLNAGYLENLEQGVFNVEGIYYRRRAQVELEWDILSNGYLDNRHEIRELENEKQIARYTYAGRQQADEIDSLQFAFQHHFNREKISLVRNYLDILEDYHKIATQLYQLNYKPWEEVIQVTSRRARAQVELENLLASNRQFKDMERHLPGNYDLPLLNIDINELLNAGRFESLQDSIFTQQVGKINNEYNSWRDISLSTFVRYNYYNSTSDINLSNVRNREYFSIGLNLSVPLPLLRSSNNRIAEAREDLLQEELTRSQNKSRKNLFADYSKYQDKLQQYLKSYEALLQLQTRITKHQQREDLNDPSYSPLALFELLTERYKVKTDLLALKRDLYGILVNLREQTPTSEFSDFLYTVNPDDYFAEGIKVSSRTAYLWSSLFADIPNEELISYLKKKRIDHLLFSMGTNSSLEEKGSSFISTAGLNGITVDLMIGDNNLLMPGHEEELKNMFLQAKELKAAGIHLDVEPHTRSDWDSREMEYKERYLKMLEMANKLAKTHGMNLSVSIPVFYDAIIGEIETYADEIYVMAYGLETTDKVRDKLRYEMKATDGALTIALRPEDFEDLKAFESFIETLSDELDMDAVAIHDVEALMKLDKIEVTLNNYEE